MVVRKCDGGCGKEADIAEKWIAWTGGTCAERLVIEHARTLGFDLTKPYTKQPQETLPG